MKDSRSPNIRSGENFQQVVEAVRATCGAYRGFVNEDRRAKPRVNERFPARIWGVDASDLPFNVDCVLDNLSSTGLYLRVPRQMDVGSQVKLIVYLLSGPTTGATATIVGGIVRDEPQRDGSHGLAVVIKKFRFL